MVILRKRSDFLKAARARRSAAPAFVLQARKRHVGEDTDESLRIGFTCSKKVGNAVARNRAKRRLRALARAVLTPEGKSGWDYVLIGRAGATATHPMSEMQDDLRKVLLRLHKQTADR